MKIPLEVKKIIQILQEAGFEAYVVGGPARDLLMGKQPKDWDLTTSATPTEIQQLFPHSFYNNRFGTVTVVNDEVSDITLKNIEVTTYRVESNYTDCRHPDIVEFTPNLEEDLKRRDFTINAMALQEVGGEFRIIDLFGGQEDLKRQLVRAVGDPVERFQEDALRMMRGVRFAAQLGFEIEASTLAAIQMHKEWLKNISAERLRDELVKILLSEDPAKGVDLLRTAGLLSYVLPELENCVGVEQNHHHIYDVYTHLLLSLKHCSSDKLEVRLASLLHDIGKPHTKAGEGRDCTFYNHDVVGAKMTYAILQRLKFPKQVIKDTTHLIRHHMFYYNPEEVTEAGVRRLVTKVGRENITDLIALRMADRLGSGTPKARPYRLRHLEYLIEKVSKDPISPKMLKINGEVIMKTLGIEPGPKIGAILKVLLAEVIEDPQKNNSEYLNQRTLELNLLTEQDIRKSEQVIIDKQLAEDQVDKDKFWIK